MLMQQILLVIHVLIAAGIIGLILMQQGKGADMGAAFGAGASGTVFGSRGSANFLTRATAVLATLFFISSLTLFIIAAKSDEPASIVDQLEQQNVEQTVPATTSDSEVPVADETVTTKDADQGKAKQSAPAPSDVPVSE